VKNYIENMSSKKAFHPAANALLASFRDMRNKGRFMTRREYTSQF